MKKRAWLFIGAFALSAVCSSAENPSFKITPVFVSQVAETTALGYGNGRKLVSDANGTMYFSAVSKAPNGLPGVCVIRTIGTGGPSFETLWIENSNGLFVSANAHFATSLTLHESGIAYVVWSGGDQTAKNDPKLARQLRFAKITAGANMKVFEAGQPFTVTGFQDVYRPPFLQNQNWQEFPSAFVSKDGKLHVVWEARDAKRTDQNNVPIPGIAYAVRDANGAWSINGDIVAPPYLDVDSVNGAQFRPFMVTDGGDTMHVVCYGEVYGRIQILYGQLRNGKFSGWKPVAFSTNDQRHASVGLDKQGRIHAVWREGGLAGQESFIVYSMRNTDGKWSPVIRADNPNRNGSTPNITVDDQAAYVVWTAWDEGFENSDSQKNNGFPNDNDTVEGELAFAYKKFNEDHFSAPVALAGGIGSYPRIARVAKSNPTKLALIWTLGKECLPQSCVQIFFSETTTPIK